MLDAYTCMLALYDAHWLGTMTRNWRRIPELTSHLITHTVKGLEYLIKLVSKGAF